MTGVRTDLLFLSKENGKKKGRKRFYNIPTTKKTNWEGREVG